MLAFALFVPAIALPAVLAKRQTVCSKCDNPILVDDPIIHLPEDDDWVHEECADEDELVADSGENWWDR